MRSAVVLSLALALAACSSRSADGAPGDGGAGPSAPRDDGGGPPPPDGGADAIAPDGPRFTVLSQNLHCLKTEGTSFATNAERFAAIAKTVADERVDVVLAQEVCTSEAENARAMLEEAFTKATGAPWSSAAAFAHRAWVGTPDEADESVAIFARGAVASVRETAHRAQGSLRRVMISATVSADATKLRVFSIHFDNATATARADQGREAASLALVETDDEKLGIGSGAVAMPVLVGGDFNARFDAAPPAAMRDFGFVETSGSEGTTRIDHVFLHASAPLAPVAHEELFTGAAAVSDHPGVLVRYAPAPAKPVRLTRVIARGTFDAPLTLRADHAPFAWDRGWPAFPLRSASEPSTAVVTSELPAAPFAFKFLRDDRDWALGDNVTGTGQADNTVTPAFP